jgi:glycosyltransferase involved in cell wall biosynthesis
MPWAANTANSSHKLPFMQITLDVSRLVLRFLEKMDPTGVDRVTLAYVQHFSKALPTTTRALIRWRGLSGMFSEARSKELFALLLRGHRDAGAEMTACLLRGMVSTWFNGDGSKSLLLQTAHQDVENEAFWRNLRWHGLRPVFFVHDLIPLTHPQFCREADAQLHRQRLLRMRQGVGLITNSQVSKHELDDFYRDTGHAAPPIMVAALGCNVVTPELIAIKQNNTRAIGHFPYKNEEKNGFLEPAYFVCLGTIEPRKNHRLLIDAWRQLLAQHEAQSVPVLRVIGQSGWGCEALERELLDASWHQGRVQWLRDCSDAQLQKQLQGARALLFPTHTEGFGLPLAEALAAGLPVLASDLAVFREFAADVPEYLPPDDAQLWAQAVLDYAQDANRRQAQLARLATWQPPSWEAHFATVMPWLEVLWQQHVGARHDRD